jgi:hypothetical protein
VATKEIPPKKNTRITYEQILNSMNMKVIDGKLVMVPLNDNDIPPNQTGLKRDNRWNKKVNTSIPEQRQTQQYYRQTEESQEQPKQMTPEQIKQMLWANEMKKRQEINRIREVKSTKLFFSTPNETARGNIIYNNQSRIGYNMFKLNR